MKPRRSLLLAMLLMLCFTAVKADWIKQNSSTFAWLRDIQFVDSNHGWIVGADGFMLSTRDGGSTWLQERKFTNDTFRQIHFINPAEGWLLCERSQFARGSDPVSYLRKTTDGGRTWEKIEFQDGGRERVLRLLFGPHGRATAFGESGVFYDIQEDGKTWKRVQTAIHYLLIGGGYGSDKIGAIVGAGGTIMFTEDGGFTWTKASLIGSTDTRFHSIFFTGTTGAWAVGTGGRIFRSNGGARLWREQASGTTASLNDVYFLNGNEGWAVGDNGVIVHTRDGGNNWTDARSPVTHKLEKVTFNNGRGWAIGFGGTVLNYIEGATPADKGTRPVIQRRN
jgi:photosystem II stability/assembly factor-like uncharacterized protein